MAKMASKVTWGVLALILLSVFMGLGWYSLKSPTQRGLKAGEAVPSFELKPLMTERGSPVSLSQFKGEGVVLVHFWASWCPPCLEELPEILGFMAKNKGQPIRLLALNLDQTREEAWRVIPRIDISQNVTLLWDPLSETSRQYGSFQFPETYVLDRELKLRAKWIGPQKWNNELLKLLQSI